MKDIVAHFESLGANCEFGFVQRAAGLEPQSLLRWAMVLAPTNLARALDADFDGLYGFDNLVPFNAQMVLDNRFRIAFHSALHSTSAKFDDSEEDRRDIHRFEAAKVADQIVKFRAVLASGERIFVFHKYFGEITPAEIATLFTALRRRGPARLLVVSLATPDEPPGSVSLLAPGLLQGRIDRFAPGNKAHDVSLDSWTEICRKALELAPNAGQSG